VLLASVCDFQWFLLASYSCAPPCSRRWMLGGIDEKPNFLSQVHPPLARSSSSQPLPLITPKSNYLLSNMFLNMHLDKCDTKAHLPSNICLSQADIEAHTTAACSSTLMENSLWLSGKAQDVLGARKA